MPDDKKILDYDKRGVEGLTEVLRLQAEALSRISERMSGMTAGGGKLPSFTSPPAARDDASDGTHLPVLAGDPALNEESLPVLNSFKKFLDEERRRGRKRFAWGLLGFTVLFSAVLAVIVWMNGERVHGLKADIQQTSIRLERTRQEAESELRKVADKAAQSAARNTAAMRSDITRNILWAHSTLASNMTSELTGRDGEIDRLKEKVSAMEVENAMLTRQVAELVHRVKVIEADYLDYLERSINESQRPVSNVVANASLAEEASPAPLRINSPGIGRPMQMRVPRE